MMKHAYVLIVFLGMLLVAELAQGQEVVTTQPATQPVYGPPPPLGVLDGLERTVVAGLPGNYNFSQTDGQMTMRTYEVTGQKPEDRVNLVSNFNKLLANDGRGGLCRVASIKRGEDGKESETILLTVSATPLMHESFAQTIEMVNSGQITFYGNLPTTVVYYPKFRSAAAIAEAVKVELTDIGVIHVDSALNALTIEDDPTVIQFLINTIAAGYDRPLPKMVVTVNVVEILDGQDRGRGVDWGALVDALPNNISLGFGADRAILAQGVGGNVGFTGADTAAFATGVNANNERLGSLKFSTFTAAVEGINPQVLGGFLQYVEAKGFCQVVQQADMVLLNDEPAVLRAVVEAPKEMTTTTAEGGKVRGESHVIEGIEISLRGVMAEEGRKVVLSATSTSIVGYGRTGIPILSRSEVNTAITLVNGQTIVVSGLQREREVESKSYGALDLCQVFPKLVKERKKTNLHICVSTKAVTPKDAEVDAPVISPKKN